MEELRSIALQGQLADGYMWTLIKLLTDADTSVFSRKNLLSRHFSNEEFPKANSRFTCLTYVESESRIDAHELQVFNDQSKMEGCIEQGDEETAAAGPSCSHQEVDVLIKKEEQKKHREPEKSKLLDSTPEVSDDSEEQNDA